MEAFDWRDYLALAAELAARTDEAAQRSAISRAYYCAYHSATDACRTKSLLPTRGHRIWDDLLGFAQVTGHQNLAEVAERGNDLKRPRVQSDYHRPFNRNDRRQRLSTLAPHAVGRTRELLALIDLM